MKGKRMLFHDPTRQMIGERPCWAKYPSTLPDVVVEIAKEAQKFIARVMVPSGESIYSFHWKETDPLGLTEVAKLLIDWHDDPEGALWRWWKETEPDSAQIAEKRQGGRQVVQRVLIPVGDVDVESLDGL